MNRNLLVAALLVGFVALAVPIIGSAQPAPGAQSAPSAIYLPGLGDLMTMTVQPRHIKLALAGREKNWTYAKYELHELEESFERVVRVRPKYRGAAIDAMMEAITKAPMAAVSQAIANQDAVQFTSAYGQLTDGCNACHQAANVGFVVIKVPDAASFPDQDFRLPKP